MSSIASPRNLKPVDTVEGHVFNSLVIGAPRTGKFWGCRKQVLDWAFEGHPAFYAFPNPNENGSLVAQDLMANGLRKKVLLDSLGSTTHCLPLVCFPKSTNRDRFAREAENADIRDRLMELAGRNRLLPPEKQPIIMELGSHAFDLCLSAEMDVTFEHLLAVGKFGHPKFHELLDHCPKSEQVWFWRMFPRKGPAMRRELSALWRLMEQKFGDPRILARQTSVDRLAEMLRAGHHVIAEGCQNRRATKTFLCMLGMAVTQCVYKEFSDTGEPFPLLKIADEVLDFELFTAYEAACEREMPKMGLHCIDLSHSHRLLADPDENGTALNNYQSVHIYRLQDWRTALECASIAGGAALDPYLVHSKETRIRQLHDGFDREQSRSVGNQSSTRSNPTEDDDWQIGYSDGSTETIGERLVPRYRNETEVYTEYVKLDDQPTIIASGLMRLGKRERLTSVFGKVFWEKVPELDLPFIIPEVGEIKWKRMKAEMLARPEYRVPSIGEPETMFSSDSFESTSPPSSKPSSSSNGRASKKSHSDPVQALLSALSNSGRKRHVP